VKKTERKGERGRDVGSKRKVLFKKLGTFENEFVSVTFINMIGTDVL